MTWLLAIRHGATDWTVVGRIQGRTDIPLSDEGRARVRRYWRMPPGLPGGNIGGTRAGWDWVCSPLTRAMETARMLGGEPAIDSRLIEQRYGAWEGRLRTEIDAELGPERLDWPSNGLDYAPPGGESPRQVQQRLRPFLAERAAARRDTIAMCHKGVIRALYALAVGWDMTCRPPQRLHDESAHLFRLAADGLPIAERLNLPLVADGTD